MPTATNFEEKKPLETPKRIKNNIFEKNLTEQSESSAKSRPLQQSSHSKNTEHIESQSINDFDSVVSNMNVGRTQSMKLVNSASLATKIV